MNVLIRNSNKLVTSHLSIFFITLYLGFVSFISTNLARAQTPGTGGGSAGTPGTGGGSAGTPGTGGGSAGTPTSEGVLVNPLQFDSITGFLMAVIDVLLIIALPIILFAIIYAGFQFVTAQGDESKVSSARSALTWAVVGGVIVLGARVIISILEGTIGAFMGA